MNEIAHFPRCPDPFIMNRQRVSRYWVHAMRQTVYGLVCKGRWQQVPDS